jgi:hypothetical protein
MFLLNAKNSKKSAWTYIRTYTWTYKKREKTVLKKMLNAKKVAGYGVFIGLNTP